MLLVKKSVILSSKSKTVGYVNVIRVAESVGVKIVFKEYEEGTYVALRLSNVIIAFPLVGEVTERQPECDFSDGDTVSCSIIRDDRIVATGGKRPPTLSEFQEALELYIDSLSVATATVLSEETTQSENTLFDSTQDFREPNDTILEPVSPEGEPHPTEEEEQSATIPTTSTETERILSGIADRDFYLSMKDKIDELFVVYPPEKVLEEAIPSSRWVRINYDVKDYYVTGVLLEDGKIIEIVYGVPTTANVNPPKGLESFCEFFPLKQNNFDGYYFIHQDVNSGEIIR